MIDRILNLLFLTSFLLISCENAQDPSTMPPDFRTNPEARESFDRLTGGGRTLPSASALTREINGEDTCLVCPPAEVRGYEASPPSSQNPNCRVGNYDNIGVCRETFVQMIINRGRNAYATTRMNLPGGTFEVMNDAPTLPDGTYVNFTLEESYQLARAWGCQLPNYDQAETIRTYAERQNARYNARPHNWENGVANNMRTMMNDSEMRSRARAGQSRLINGHFKWYINDGRNVPDNQHNFQFYGFYAPGACSEYCQDRGSSGGHGRGYIDYSQSVRLICPAS